MMPRRITSHEPGAPGWLNQRRSRLGGSEIAAALGLSPHESPFSLWHRKANLLPPVEDRPAMEWGRRLEDVVAAKFFDDHPEFTDLGRGTWVHPDHDWMLASPDRIMDGPGGKTGLLAATLLEIKTARHDYDWGTPGTDEIPVWYLTQVRWYMAILGCPDAHLAVLIGGSDYREYYIEQDAADVELMMHAGRAFLDSLAADQPPDIDASSATYQAVRQLHPDIDNTDAEIPADLAGDYLDAVITAAGVNDRLCELKSRVAHVMGSARNALLDGERLAYRMARSSRGICPDCEGRIDDARTCATCKGKGVVVTPGTPFLVPDSRTLNRLTKGDSA